MFIGDRMSTEQAIVEFKVVTAGLVEAQAGAQKLYDLMKAASDVAATIRVPTAVQAAQAQVAASNTGGRARRPVAAAAAPAGSSEQEDYRTSRGMTGTGAEGRDFAKQASGLGGLVHVYATFAANLFAVSAAFSALSRAADTTNMIKGLDQLSAQSGRSLGSLAKSMVETTNGALSLKEAMTSTALASSAGMTNSAIIRMTEVAKKASLALGRDMGDSMDRLTKGIAKTQPELLDELGIMAKVIPSQQAYARELGKSVSALTDFEKKQAFANSVLEEGEKKFSAITIDTNPYTQLTASLANLAQGGLALVNTVLGPLAEGLAKSPTALGVAVAGIAGILIKQAIPALGQYRKGLEALKAESLAKVANLSNITAEAGHEYDVKVVGERAKQKYLLETDYAKKSAAEQAKIMLEADKRAGDAADKATARATSVFGHETVTNKIRDRAYQDAAMAASRYSVSQIQSAYGVRAAFGELNIELNKLKEGTAKIDIGGIATAVPKLGYLKLGIMGVSAAVGILGSAIGTLLNAFQPIILAVTLISTGVAFLVEHFKKAGKEVDAASAAFEGVSGAMKTVGDTLDAIAKKPFLEQINSASIQAKASALNELSSSMILLSKRTTEAFNKIAKESSSFADTFNDARIFNVIGKLLSGQTISFADRSKLGKQLASGTQEAISGAAKLVEGSSAEQGFKASLKNILGITYKDAADLEAQLSKIPDTLIAKQPRLQKALEETNRAVNNVASATKDLNAAWDDANRSLDGIIASLGLTDPLGKLGDESIKVGDKMSKAFDTSETRLAELSKTATEFSRLRFLNPETQRDMIIYAQGLEASGKKIDALKDKLKVSKAKESAAVTVSNMPTFDSMGGVTGSTESVVTDKVKLEAAQTNSKNIQKQIDAEAAKLDNQDLYLRAQSEMFASGAKKVEASISQAFAKAAITLSQSLVSTTGNTKEGLQRQAELQKQQIDIESANLGAMLELAAATNSLAKIQEEILIQTKKQQLEADKVSGKITGTEYAKESSKVTKRGAVLEASREVKSFKQTVTDLKSKDEVTREAAQMNYSLRATTESIRAQIALNNAKKGGIDIDEKSKEILLDVEGEVKRNELLAKGLSLRATQLSYITQSASYESSTATLLKQEVEEQLALTTEAKDRLATLGQIRDAQMRLNKASDPKDKLAINASLAKFQQDLAQKNELFDKDRSIRAFKYAQDRKTAQIAEFNYAKDFQLLNNTINSESLAAIQALSSGYLDFVNQQKLAIDLSNLKLNYEKQSNVELQNELALTSQLNKLKSDPKSDPKVIGVVETQIAEARNRSNQTNLKYQSDISNLTNKSLKDRLDGIESIRKAEADLVLSQISSASKIANLKLDLEDKFLQAKVTLGYISETTAAKEAANRSTTRLAQEIALQKAENDKLAEDNLKAAQNRAVLETKAIEAVEQDYRNKKELLEKQTQARINEIKLAPTIKPGETAMAGGVTQDIQTTQISQVITGGVEATKKLEEDRLAAIQQLGAATSLEDKKATTALTQKKDEQTAVNNLKTAEIGITKSIADEQAKLNQLTKDQAFYTNQAEQAAKSLVSTFGDLGKTLGEVAKTIVSTANATKQYDADRLKALKQIENAKGNPKEEEQATQNLSKLDKQYTAQKLDNIATIAGQTAQLFDKNQNGYKLLMNIEKAMHIYKMLTMAMEMGMWVKNFAVRMAGIAQEMAAEISKGAASMMSSAGNFLGMGAGAAVGGEAAGAAAGAGAAGAGAAGAGAGAAGAGAAGAGAGAAAGGGMAAAVPYVAMAVAAVALLSWLSKADEKAGPSPEELASVSGTGMRYNAAGQLEASGTGALGDAKAANEGIQKGIEYLGKVNYENLQFDKNKALIALEAIRDNTQNFVKAIGPTGSIGNLTAGGTQLGSSKSGFLGFGSSSTELAASGVAITGTIKEIAEGIGGSAKKFEDIRKSSSSWWGLSSSSEVVHNEEEVGKAAKQFMQMTAINFRDAITATASSFGQDGGLLKPIIDSFDMSFTAYQTGETGADFAARVQQEIGNKLDQAAKMVFPGIDALAGKFQNFGETLGEFALRVQGDSEQIKFAFQSIGQAYIDPTAGGPTGALIQRESEQNLIKIFGTSQDLFAAIDKYGNSMLTEAEKLAPIRENVDKKLVELFPTLTSGGKTLITTRKQFDELRQSLDPLNPATADLWASMTKLGPSFSMVTDAVVTLTDAELKKAKQDQYSTILALKDDDVSKAKALAISRQNELDAMDDLLKPNQMYIYALQDEATAKSKLQTSYDKVKTAINGTVDSLKTQISTLQDYKKNLQLSDKGNLTPQEAYAASKGQLESTAALAQTTLGTDATKEQVAARDKAVASLPSLMDQFLTQSKTSYASGDQYQADYSWVNSLLDTTTEQLTLQETDAQKQLTALTDSVSYLTLIDDSTKTTANLMADFLTNQSSYEQAAASATSLLSADMTAILNALTTTVSPKGFAAGGLAEPGVHMVGETGPEMVDFSSPGRVYNASQTSAFGDNTALVAELKALRDEVSQLRADQKEQTGHLIQSNYDASNKNAQAVSNITENAIKQQDWKSRSQVVLA